MNTKTKIIIITDDGTSSKNTENLYFILEELGYNPKIYATEKKRSAKSTSISLKPIKIQENGIYKIFDGYPADCLLYSIFNEKNKDNLHIFGINEHNHFGYSNYIGSTTTLLLLAKHYNINAFSLSSQIKLEKDDIKCFLSRITKIRFPDSDMYFSFNINNTKIYDFIYAKISKTLEDKYIHYNTHRGEYILLTFNQEEKKPNSTRDIFYQMSDMNYYVVI